MPADAAPIFGQLNLVVADMAASIAFYRRLGLAIDDTHPYARHHVNVETPDGFSLDLDSVEFAKRWDVGWRAGTGSGRVVVGFNVASRDAVDALYARMTAAGAVGQQPPTDAFWGARYAVIEDPDGNPVGLMSPIDPARRSAPPAI